jgi:hypothetical protein
MTGTLTRPDPSPSEHSGDGRSLPLLIAAAVLVVAVVGAVLLFGVERPPGLTRLADQPDPEPPAAVAWMGSGGMETCVRIAWPEATVTEPWCDRAGGDLVGWTDEGILLHRWEGSESIRVLDPVSGEFVGRSREGRWEPPYEQPAAWTERRDGELIVRLDDDTVVWRVETTDRYEIRTSAISADGAWVAMVDSADRLLLVPADGSSPPRVWTEGVTAWQTPIWEGTTFLR